MPVLETRTLLLTEKIQCILDAKGLPVQSNQNPNNNFGGTSRISNAPPTENPGGK